MAPLVDLCDTHKIVNKTDVNPLSPNINLKNDMDVVSFNSFETHL